MHCGWDRWVPVTCATGITSRTVAFAVGGIYLTLTFLPKAGTIFAIMPAPVVGATLLFAAALVFVNGLIIITSRMLDSRDFLYRLMDTLRLVEWATVEQFHRDVRTALDLAHVEDGDDIRMRQHAGGLGFSQKALAMRSASSAGLRALTMVAPASGAVGGFSLVIGGVSYGVVERKYAAISPCLSSTALVW